MTQGRRAAAVRHALNVFDNWVEVTGFVEPHTSYYYEMQSIVTDAVEIGIRAAFGIDYKKIGEDYPDDASTEEIIPQETNGSVGY